MATYDVDDRSAIVTGGGSEIGRAVASFITGSCHLVDGGYTAQ